MTLKAEDFVELGMTDDERSAIEEARREEGDEAKTEEAAKASDKPTDATDGDKAGDQGKDDAAKATDTKGDDAKKAEGAEGADAAKTAADAAKVEDTKTEDAAPAPGRQAVPDWKAPADAEAKLTELKQQREALAEQFDNGELTAKELFAKQGEIDDQVHTLRRAVDRAEDAADMRKAWWMETAVPSFLDAHAQYRGHPAAMRALDTEVRELQVAATQAGKDPLDPAILTKAHEAVQEAFAAFSGAPASKPAGDDGKAKDAGKLAVQPGKPGFPPTLANIPASEISGTDSKFTALDQLANSNPVQFEDAVAKLSDAERERYLSRVN